MKKIADFRYNKVLYKSILDSGKAANLKHYTPMMPNVEYSPPKVEKQETMRIAPFSRESLESRALSEELHKFTN